jgi:hypothetical protein
MQIFEIKEKTNKIEEFITSNEINLLINQRFLLNKEIDNYIELYVHKIACFHLNRIGLPFDENKHIEFTFYNRSKIANDILLFGNNITISPITTSITYFYNNNFSPSLITNINYKNYKYKTFYNESLNLIFSFPEKNKHIFFDETDNYYGKFYCDDSKNECIELVVKLWEGKPDIPYFYFNNHISEQSKFDESLFEVDINKNNDEVMEINIKNEAYKNLLTYDFLDEIIYSLNVNCLKKVILLSNEKKNFVIVNKDPPTVNIISDELPINLLEIQNGEVNLKKVHVEIFPIFIQRHHMHFYYTSDICSWIIQEIMDNNIEWIKDSKFSYYQISEKIPELSTFISLSLKNIVLKVNELYNLSDNFVFNIKDIMFIKYDNCVNLSKYNNSNFSNDNSGFVFKILLSDINQFSGGNIMFEDNTIQKLKTGDLIIHNGHVKYYEQPVLTGEKIYILFKLNLYEKDSTESWFEKFIKTN